MNEKLEIIPLSPTIGAEIRGLDLSKPLSGDDVAAVKQAWLDHILVLFRGQKLAQEDLLRVTSYFGPIGAPARPAKYFPPGFTKLPPEIMMISNIRENGEPIGALPDGEIMFHHDKIFEDLPDAGTMLYSLEVPNEGGDTLFASGYAAYDTLDPAFRDELEGRRARHQYMYGSVVKGDGKGLALSNESRHPLFRTHDATKRKAIYVNRLATIGIEGLSDEEAAPILDRLYDHAEQEKFVYAHKWRVGDVLLWDNRCSTHARTDFPENQRRLMLRTTIKADVAPF